MSVSISNSHGTHLCSLSKLYFIGDSNDINDDHYRLDIQMDGSFPSGIYRDRKIDVMTDVDIFECDIFIFASLV